MTLHLSGVKIKLLKCCLLDVHTLLLFIGLFFECISLSETVLYDIECNMFDMLFNGTHMSYLSQPLRS